jgi:hypothetical protein
MKESGGIADLAEFIFRIFQGRHVVMTFHALMEQKQRWSVFTIFWTLKYPCTLDILGVQRFYEWWQRGESNSRPRAYESPALPLSYSAIPVLVRSRAVRLPMSVILSNMKRSFSRPAAMERF